jgi:hypothetical protein
MWQQHAVIEVPGGKSKHFKPPVTMWCCAFRTYHNLSLLMPSLFSKDIITRLYVWLSNDLFSKYPATAGHPTSIIFPNNMLRATLTFKVQEFKFPCTTSRPD